MGERFVERRAACAGMNITSAEPALHIMTHQPSIQRTSGMSSASNEGAFSGEGKKVTSTSVSTSSPRVEIISGNANQQTVSTLTPSTSSATPPTGSSASSESQMLSFGRAEATSPGKGGFSTGVEDGGSGAVKVQGRRMLDGSARPPVGAPQHSARQSQDTFQEGGGQGPSFGALQSQPNQSREGWMNQAPRHGGAVVGAGGGTISSSSGNVIGSVCPQQQQTGGEVVEAGEASIEAATAKLHLDSDDDDVGGVGDVKRGIIDGGGGEDQRDQSSRGDQWQHGSSGEEREPHPKFGLKVLVPGLTAGCLIGKGGRIINQLQTTTGTRVKLSQKNEFFPGTHDRVALVQGEQPTMVGEAVAEMLRRLREAGRQHPHSTQSMVMPYGPYGFHLGGGGFTNGGMEGRNSQVTVRLLVPLAAGGLIIGKGGETIKAIGARTGARVILAGKDADVAGVPSERMCSIQGDLEGAIKVVLMIVGKMAEDRGLSKYQSNQTCYQTGLAGPLTPGMVTDGGHQPQNLPASNAMPVQTHWGRPNRSLSGGVEMGTFPVEQHTGSGNPWGGVNDTGSSIDGPGGVMGPSPAPVCGLANGVSTPSASGGCGMGGPQQRLQQHQSQQQPQQQQPQQQQPPQQQPPQHPIPQQQPQHQHVALATSSHVPGMMPVYGFPFQFAAMQPQRPFGDAYAQGNIAGMPSVYPYGSEVAFMTPTGSPQGPVPEIYMDGGDMLAQTQVAVPDNMVGVILGKGGATVIDMQNITGARIQVSQRGDYIPGTQNRAVTISGTQQAVASAQAMLHNVCAQASQYEVRQVQGMHQVQPHQMHQQQTHQPQQFPPPHQQPPFY